MPIPWTMNGTLLGACSCDWGCPCSFDAPPTKGICEGGYTWLIAQGRFKDVPLDGLSLSWLAHSPGPLHLGNVTSLILIDEKANPAQRAALMTLFEGKSGGPWTIFAAVTSRRFGPHYVPYQVKLDGLNSHVRAGSALEVALGPILNPVSKEPEELYLEKPTGFTSKRVTLGASKILRVDSDLKYDHSGQYGEFSHFDYAGEAEA